MTCTAWAGSTTLASRKMPGSTLSPSSQLSFYALVKCLMSTRWKLFQDPLWKRVTDQSLSFRGHDHVANCNSNFLVTQARSLMDSMAYTVMSSKELSIRITHIQNQLLRLRKSEVTVPCTGNKDWTAHVYPECNTLADQMSLRDEDDAFCNVFIPHSKDTYAATGFFDASFHIEDGRAWSGWGIYILSFGMSHWKIAQVGSRRQDCTSSVAMAEAKAALDLVNAIQIRCGKTPRRQDE